MARRDKLERKLASRFVPEANLGVALVPTSRGDFARRRLHRLNSAERDQLQNRLDEGSTLAADEYRTNLKLSLVLATLVSVGWMSLFWWARPTFATLTMVAILFVVLGVVVTLIQLAMDGWCHSALANTIDWLQQRPTADTDRVEALVLNKTPEDEQLMLALSALNSVVSSPAFTSEHTDVLAVRLALMQERRILLGRHRLLTQTRVEAIRLGTAGDADMAAVLVDDIEAMVAASEPRVRALVDYASKMEQLGVALRRAASLESSQVYREKLVDTLASTEADTFATQVLEGHGEWAQLVGEQQRSASAELETAHEVLTTMLRPLPPPVVRTPLPQ